MDAQYVKDLLEDKPAAAPQATAEAEPFDTDFDLSLDELEAASPAALDKTDQQTFEALLQQQTDAKPSPEDLSDFDLDLQLDPPASQSDDDFLSGLEDQMKDVSPVEPPTLTPAAWTTSTCRKTSTCPWLTSRTPGGQTRCVRLGTG